MSQELPKLLVLRPDRLGDVLLSLPAVKSLAGVSSGKYKIDFLIQKNLVDLLTPVLKTWGVSVVTEIARPYDAAISLFDETSLTCSWKHLKIPMRIGPYSKWKSFFCFNLGVFQKRSRGGKGETEYCFELVAKACAALELPAPVLSLSKLPEDPKSQIALKKKVQPQKPYWVLHPGMGGSAENLSLKAYAHLAHLLQKRHPDLDVWVGIGPAALDQIFKTLVLEIAGAREVPALSLAEYAEFLREAEFVVAPSTGPLHLAHWVGTKTLGIYSPVKAHLAQRWAPFGGQGKSYIWEPRGVACPGTKRCVGQSCKEYFCMDTPVLKWEESDLERVFP